MIRYVLPLCVVLALTIASTQLAGAQNSVGETVDEVEADEETSSPRRAVRSLRPGPAMAPLLEAVCPGDIDIDERSAGCTVCPEAAPRSQGRLSVRRAFMGHFSPSGREAAIVSLRGCAASNADSHASAFLERRGQDWELADYQQGMNTSGCRIETVEDHTVLVCHSRSVDEGRSTGSVFGLAHGQDGWTVEALTSLHEGTEECQYDGETRRALRSIYVGEMSDDGDAIGILIKSEHGVAKEEDAPCEADAFDTDSTLELKVFRPVNEGFEAVEFDGLCDHEGRAAFVNAVEPGGCN